MRMREVEKHLFIVETDFNIENIRTSILQLQKLIEKDSNLSEKLNKRLLLSLLKVINDNIEEIGLLSACGQVFRFVLRNEDNLSNYGEIVVQPLLNLLKTKSDNVKVISGVVAIMTNLLCEEIMRKRYAESVLSALIPQLDVTTISKIQDEAEEFCARSFGCLRNIFCENLLREKYGTQVLPLVLKIFKLYDKSANVCEKGCWTIRNIIEDKNAAAKYKDELTDILLKLYSTHKLPKQRKAICACLYKFDIPPTFVSRLSVLAQSMCPSGHPLAETSTAAIGRNAAVVCDTCGGRWEDGVLKTKECVDAEKHAGKEQNGCCSVCDKKEGSLQKKTNESGKASSAHGDCVFYGCRKCNFDVCPNCIEKARQLSKK